jgi:hypothetical protein
MLNRLAGFKSWLGYWVHAFTAKHTYMLVARADGSAAFCSFGCNRAVTHFARYYLNVGDAAVVRRQWYWRNQVCQVRLLAKRHGLVLAKEELATTGLKNNTIAWPQLVELVIDLPTSLDDYRKGLKGTAKSDLSRIRRYGFTSKVSRDTERLKAFYHGMFLPSMSGRHGGNGYVFPLADLQNIMNKDPRNGLLELWSGNNWVAGLLYEIKGTEFHTRRVGWLNGDPAIHQLGVSGALHWFAVVKAIEMGCEQLVFGGVAPYLEDGLFHAKTKWSAQLSHEHSHFRQWRAMLDRSHPDCRKFFQAFSLLLTSEVAANFEVLSLRERGDVKPATNQANCIGEWHQLDRIDATQRTGILG